MSNQELYQYFLTLQKEYIFCKYRAFFYKKEKDKEFWDQVSLKKKEKILSLELRNSWRSLFVSKDIFEKVCNESFPIGRFPQFTYKSLEEQSELERIDLACFYQKDCKLSLYKKEQFLCYGSVIRFFFNQRKVLLEFMDHSRFSLDLDSDEIQACRLDIVSSILIL